MNLSTKSNSCVSKNILHFLYLRNMNNDGMLILNQESRVSADDFWGLLYFIKFIVLCVTKNINPLCFEREKHLILSSSPTELKLQTEVLHILQDVLMMLQTALEAFYERKI